jgi:hypothetical protein
MFHLRGICVRAKGAKRPGQGNDEHGISKVKLWNKVSSFSNFDRDWRMYV